MASFDDIEDETFFERVCALKEMFPEPVQKTISTAASTTAWTVSPKERERYTDRQKQRGERMMLFFLLLF